MCTPINQYSFNLMTLPLARCIFTFCDNLRKNYMNTLILYIICS